MWVTNKYERFKEHKGPVVFLAPKNYGVYHLIAEFENTQTQLIWFKLTEADKNDPIAQGNKLVAALKHYLGNLIVEALPYSYAVSSLRSYSALLGHISVALSGAEHSPEFAKELLNLQSENTQIILHFNKETTFTPSPDSLVITKEDLALNLEEATQFSSSFLSEQETLKLLSKTANARDSFLAELCRHQQAPPRLTPGPNGLEFPDGYGPSVDPEALLSVLVAKEHWADALSLAVAKFPERVPEFINQAGRYLHERGMHTRLDTLLSQLPAEIQLNEKVLFRRLSVAFRFGKAQDLRAEVEAHLGNHDAPELRALYAGVLLQLEDSVVEAKKAYDLKPCNFTAYQYGFRTLDIDKSLDLLEQSVRLAEQERQPYDALRNAAALCARLNYKGNYKEAVSWGNWAYTEFQKRGIADSVLRLKIINAWAHARILSDKLVGLEYLLSNEEKCLDAVYPELANLFRETLGEYYLATDRPALALEQFRRLSDFSLRVRSGQVAYSMTRTLLELGELDNAKTIAFAAFTLTKKDHSFHSALASLAYGMSLVEQDSQTALIHLGNAQKALSETRNAFRLASAILYSALAYMKLNQTSKARTLIQENQELLAQLSATGLKLSSGSEATFRGVWELICEREVPLELRFLGATEVWLNNKLIKCQPRQLEVLALLALKNRPMSLEELLADLFGDGGNKKNLKATLSKCRSQLPISSHPYCFTVNVKADFLDLTQQLERGELEAAMSLYKGSFLPKSDSPIIRDEDFALASLLREKCLASGSIEALMKLSELFPDDLEVFEVLNDTLTESDPRKAGVRYRSEIIRQKWFSSKN